MEITMNVPVIINQPGADWLPNTLLPAAGIKKDQNGRTLLPSRLPIPQIGPSRAFWDVVMNGPPRQQATTQEQAAESAAPRTAGQNAAWVQTHPHVCPFAGCIQRFKAAKEIKMHVRAFHNEEFKCDVCYRLLSSKVKLMNHQAHKIPCRPPPSMK